MLRFSFQFKSAATPKNMQRQLKMAGQTVESVPDAPALSEALEMYHDAFYDLCTTRSIGMALGPISVLSVDTYASNRQYTAFQLYFLRRVVRRLDPIFMEYSNESKKPKNGKKSR